MRGVIHGRNTTASISAIFASGTPLDQVCAQHGRASDVVTDGRRPLDAPEIDQLGEDLSVYLDAELLVDVPLRFAEAEHFEDVDAVRCRKRRGDPPPDHRGRRRSVHEDHRGTAADDVEGDLPPRGRGLLPELRAHRPNPSTPAP